MKENPNILVGSSVLQINYLQKKKKTRIDYFSFFSLSLSLSLSRTFNEALTDESREKR
jgi:hypothetical protein